MPIKNVNKTEYTLKLVNAPKRHSKHLAIRNSFP